MRGILSGTRSMPPLFVAQKLLLALLNTQRFVLLKCQTIRMKERVPVPEVMMPVTGPRPVMSVDAAGRKLRMNMRPV